MLRAYRGYYAAGGTAFLPGTIRAPKASSSSSTWRPSSLSPSPQCFPGHAAPWAGADHGWCCWACAGWSRWLLHACLNEMAQRVLSVAGLVHIHYPPLWATVNDRAADLQNLFGNEPWFLLQGLAFGALGWIVLGPGRPRWRWAVSAWPRPAPDPRRPAVGDRRHRQGHRRLKDCLMQRGQLDQRVVGGQT